VSAANRSTILLQTRYSRWTQLRCNHNTCTAPLPQVYSGIVASSCNPLNVPIRSAAAAIIAIAARGVAPETAVRIITNVREDEAEFDRDILAAEQQYARTQSVWE